MWLFFAFLWGCVIGVVPVIGQVFGIMAFCEVEKGHELCSVNCLNSDGSSLDFFCGVCHYMNVEDGRKKAVGRKRQVGNG